MPEIHLQTTNLDSTFKALRSRDPSKLSRSSVPRHGDYKSIPRQNFAPVSSAHTGAWGNGMAKFASVASAGTIYGQPQFFSPVHTPINWQIPSKRLEIYQWSRFFYENEPKVAAAIDFYSYFPMSDWEHECRDREVKLYFDKFKKRLGLQKWVRMISHEVHLLGDCFPFAEISCEHCHGSGMIGDELCDHEGGTIRRMIVLNPDFVDVHSGALDPEPIIALRPDEELINMVQRKTPGHERLSPEVISLVSSGQPIRLDNRNVAHLKYGECGYNRYGIGMVRRLFPILSYKTKLMVAQWIVAERLIVPIKIVKVGSDERPAGPADIAAVQAQLAETANDPNLTIVTHHAFELDWIGAAGKVLTLSNELEFINQEVLDGMMINNALLNGEGPNFSAAAVGIEAMIQRLNTFRNYIAEWIEEFLYLPEARRQGFIDENPETDDEEYLIPKIKWNSMHLRDQQQYRTFIIQLYEKGLVSAQTVLEAFEIDPDQEIERKRHDAVQMLALGQGAGGAQGGMGDGFGGDMGMGGMPMGGGDMGMGGEPPIGAPGGDGMGAPPAPTGGEPVLAKSTSLTAEVVDPSQFGGKVLKKKTRDKMMSEQKSVYDKQDKQKSLQEDQNGQIRDEKGRIAFTKLERVLIDHLIQAQKDGLIKYNIVPQYTLMVGDHEHPVDFALPQLKLIIEADGEIYHSSPKQLQKDSERDRQLNQMGWTVLRFKDSEIEKQVQQVMSTIMASIKQKEDAIKNNNPEANQEAQ
jgi:very-short-patch-repair endonuclease